MKNPRNYRNQTTQLLTRTGTIFAAILSLFLGIQVVQADTNLPMVELEMAPQAPVAPDTQGGKFQVELLDFHSYPFPGNPYLAPGSYLRVHHHPCNDPNITRPWGFGYFYRDGEPSIRIDTASDMKCARDLPLTYTVYLGGPDQEEVALAEISNFRRSLAQIVITSRDGGPVSFYAGETELPLRLEEGASEYLRISEDLIIVLGDDGSAPTPGDDSEEGTEDDGPGLDGVCPSCSDPLVAVPDPETPDDESDPDTDTTGVGLGTGDPGDKVIAREDLPEQNVTISGGGLACSLQAKPNQPWGFDFLIFTLLALGLPAGWIWQKK